jgi:hypothetical protein
LDKQTEIKVQFNPQMCKKIKIILILGRELGFAIPEGILLSEL